MGLRKRLKAAVRAFRGKPADHLNLSLGVEMKRCDKCSKAEPREAEWRLYPETVKTGWACSFCKRPAARDWDLEALPTPYCPWCGSRMTYIEPQKEAEQ